MEPGDPMAGKSRGSGVARVLAPLALIVTLLVVVFVISSSLGGDDSGSGSGRSGKPTAPKSQSSGGGDEAPDEYVVKSGDSLSTISEDTGISIERIQKLNPDVDPQALIEGQTLKLK
jgi:LysM repeat protein